MNYNFSTCISMLSLLPFALTILYFFAIIVEDLIAGLSTYI